MDGDGFSTLLDIDKLTLYFSNQSAPIRFSTLLDIDKLTQGLVLPISYLVLVLCWILINLHR